MIIFGENIFICYVFWTFNDDIVLQCLGIIKQGLFHIFGAIRIESLFNLGDIKIRD